MPVSALLLHLCDVPPKPFARFFASPGSSRAAVQATWNYVAVARVLSADRRIHREDSAVKVANAENHRRVFCLKGGPDFLDEPELTRIAKGLVVFLVFQGNPY